MVIADGKGLQWLREGADLKNTEGMVGSNVLGGAGMVLFLPYPESKGSKDRLWSNKEHLSGSGVSQPGSCGCLLLLWTFVRRGIQKTRR